MPLINLAPAKGQLNIPLDDDSLDEEVQLWAAATTLAVGKAKGEIIDPCSITDERRVDGATSVVLSGTPVIDLTSVATVDGATTWDTSSLHVNKRTGELTVLSGPALKGLVAFVYEAGYADPPANYRVGGLIILQHLWETKRGAPSPQMGGSDDVYIPQLGYAIPRRAAELLGLSLPGIA